MKNFMTLVLVILISGCARGPTHYIFDPVDIKLYPQEIEQSKAREKVFDAIVNIIASSYHSKQPDANSQYFGSDNFLRSYLQGDYKLQQIYHSDNGREVAAIFHPPSDWGIPYKNQKHEYVAFILISLGSSPYFSVYKANPFDSIFVELNDIRFDWGFTTSLPTVSQYRCDVKVFNRQRTSYRKVVGYGDKSHEEVRYLFSVYHAWHPVQASKFKCIGGYNHIANHYAKKHVRGYNGHGIMEENIVRDNLSIIMAAFPEIKYKFGSNSFREESSIVYP